MYRHQNTLPFFYHEETGVVTWTKPYVKRIKVKEHIPPLSAFSVILKYHQQELKEAKKQLDIARKKRVSREAAVKAAKEMIDKIVATKVAKSGGSSSSSSTTTSTSSSTSTENNQTNSNINNNNNITNNQTSKLVEGESQDLPLEPDDSGPLITSEEFQLPKDLQQIQSYLIMLVAAMVQLEKRRRKKSYEDYLAEDEDGGKQYLKNNDLSYPFAFAYLIPLPLSFVCCYPYYSWH